MTGEGLRLEKKLSQRGDRKGMDLGHWGDDTFLENQKEKPTAIQSNTQSLYNQVLLVVTFCSYNQKLVFPDYAFKIALPPDPFLHPISLIKSPQ